MREEGEISKGAMALFTDIDFVRRRIEEQKEYIHTYFNGRKIRSKDKRPDWEAVLKSARDQLYFFESLEQQLLSLNKKSE